jgi:hypothetical protein
MSTKYGFGGLKRTVNEGPLVGKQTGVFGPRYVVPAIAKASDNLEFGEVVVISGNTEKGYIVRPLTTGDDATEKLGVIYRDEVGTYQKAGIPTIGSENVTVSVFLLDPANKGTISIALIGSAVTVGNTVYIGLGTDETGIRGAGYPASVATHTFALTGWVFKSAVYEPTDTTAKAVRIGLA